uniref:Uncharacterized protein n=1 Tax=Rhizophora mucronata TaxID=61149 RepID=A0A2P2QFF6_RHIMU
MIHYALNSLLMQLFLSWNFQSRMFQMVIYF